MVEVKGAFERKYGASLADWIASETSGHYQRILLALINGQPSGDAKALKAKLKLQPDERCVAGLQTFFIGHF